MQHNNNKTHITKYKITKINVMLVLPTYVFLQTSLKKCTCTLRTGNCTKNKNELSATSCFF